MSFIGSEGLGFAFKINNKAPYMVLSHVFAFAEPIAIDTKTNKVYVTDS